MLLVGSEKAYVVEQNVKLYETKASRSGTGAGARIGRVFIGKSESQEVNKLVEIDLGQLVITTERISFSGQTEQRTVLLSDIQDIESQADFFSIASKKRDRKSLFQVKNPMLWQIVVRNILNGNFEKSFREGLES